MKTKTVSRQLEVNPSTIQRWVKYFDLPCRKNDHGHLLFSQQDIEVLKHIKTQLNSGLAMNEVELSIEEEEPVPNVSISQYEKQLDKMVSKIDDVERKLSQKADEVVSVQLYQHRGELDELIKTMSDMQTRLQTIEGQLSSLNLPEQNEEKLKKENKPKRNWLVSLFGT